MDVNEFMRIKHQKGFKISPIQGAEQIQMEVIVLANEGHLDKLNMEISADTIRVENSKPNNDIFKEFIGEDFEYSEEADLKANSTFAR